MGTSAFVSCFSVKTLGWEVPPARHPDTRIFGCTGIHAGTTSPAARSYASCPVSRRMMCALRFSWLSRLKVIHARSHAKDQHFDFLTLPMFPPKSNWGDGRESNPRKLLSQSSSGYRHLTPSHCRSPGGANLIPRAGSAPGSSALKGRPPSY